jgi:HEAT repeat protein
LLVAGPALTKAQAQEPDHAKDFEYWRKAITDPDANKRREAASSLGYLGRFGQPVVPLLIGAMDDPNSGVRFSTTRALAELGARALPAVHRLVAELGAKDWGGAHEALAMIGAASIPGLLETAPSSPQLLKDHVAATLYLIEPEGLAAATRALETSPDPGFREALARASLIVNDRAVPSLVKALRDCSVPVRVASAKRSYRNVIRRRHA